MLDKECNTCKLSLPLIMFDVNRYKDKETYRNKCKDCRLKDKQCRLKISKTKEKIIIKLKKCNKCDVELDIDNFNKDSYSIDGYAKICRSCYSITRHKIKHTISPLTDVLFCKKCKLNKPNTEFISNARSKSGYFMVCLSCWKPREWNKQKQQESEKKYISKNRDKILEKYKRQSALPQRRFRDRINKRIKSAFKSINNRKNNSTCEYLGCDMNYLKKWFEFQFTDNIGWNNMSEWHIDHVIPCSHYDLTNYEQQKECFNWKNLRPCLAKENLEKNSKIIEAIINTHKDTVLKFLEINPLPT